MKGSSIGPFVILVVIFFAPVCAHAQEGAFVREAITELVEFFAKTGAKTGAETVATTAAKELAEIGGEKAVREVLEKAAKEGGDDLVRQVVLLGKSNGPRAIKALEGEPALMTKALQGLPKGSMADVVAEASSQPTLMAKLVRAQGEEVLTASASHPGIGLQVIDEFGGAGLKAAKTLGTDDVIILARTRGFRELPLASQSKFISLLDRDPRAVINFLMLAGGGTAIVMTADLVNKMEKKVIGTDGKPGTGEQAIRSYTWIIGGVGVAAMAAYFAIKLWGAWRHTKRKTQ